MIANGLDDKMHPLPLPPFRRTLRTLSLQELKRVCWRHDAICQNLARRIPMTRKETILPLPAEHGAVFHVAFLPGGRHVLTMSVHGLFSCWDIEEMPVSSHGSTAEKVVGKPLVSLETGLRPIMWNFHTTGDGQVLIAFYGSTRE